MKNRILSLLIVLIFALTLMSVTAQAAPTSRIEGVDYGRIDENVNLRQKVEFDIGERRFTGYLQNGNTLTEEEVDAIIKGVMNEMEITSGVLLYSEDIIKKAAQNKGFNPKVVLELGTKLALEAAELDTMVELYDVATGKKSVPDAVAGYIIGKSVSTICEKYIAGIPGLVLKGLWSSADIVARETARLVEESKIAQQSLERTYLLDLFYITCNERIEAEEKAKGENTWSIECNQTVWCQKTLFNVPVIQYWKLSCDLTRTDNLYGDRDDPTNYGGVYRGTMVIDIWHDLSNFDEQFQTQVFGKFPMTKIWDRLVNFHDEYSASSLTKQLISTNVEIHLDQNNMTSNGMTEYFMLNTFSDTSVFNMKHFVRGPFNHLVYKDGVWDDVWHTENGTVTVHAEASYNNHFAGNLIYANRYPQIIWKQFDCIIKEDITVPIVGVQRYDFSQTDTIEYPIMTDYKIFEDLQGNRGMLTVLGR